MPTELKDRIQSDVKDAMRAKAKERLGTLRLVTAAIKQKEVDERVEMDDDQVLQVLTKMVKQRQDSITQYTDAGRDDLAAQEQAELAIIGEYMPAALSEEELKELVSKALAETGAQSIKDMGKVMGVLRPAVQGRADMGAVSAQVKQALGRL
tara:strand:- start:48 stop:503 length:456 start_codon:yes stop_codon:yes gene_type:complete